MHFQDVPTTNITSVSLGVHAFNLYSDYITGDNVASLYQCAFAPPPPLPPLPPPGLPLAPGLPNPDWDKYCSEIINTGAPRVRVWEGCYCC